MATYTRLTCVHGATEEADRLIIIHINVAFEARCFEVSFNLDPVEEPAIGTVDTYVNRGDTSHAAASARHMEDVYTAIIENIGTLRVCY